MATLSMDDAVVQYGAIAFQNEICVVRAKTVATKKPYVQVVVHKKDAAGVEQLPHGYVLGTNMLICS